MASAQQTRKIGNVATVSAKTMELDWSAGSNVIDFSGNVKVTLTGQRNAQMTAAAVRVVLTKKLDDLVSLQATGPVVFSSVARFRQGGARQLTCRASGGAQYTGEGKLLRLTGGATASLKPAEDAGGTALQMDLPAWAQTLDVAAQTITAHLATDVIELAGGVEVDVSGQYATHLTAPAMRVTAADQAIGVVAEGPVDFRSTGKDKNGAERTIKGRAQERAEYTGSDRKLRLIGGAVVDVLPTMTEQGVGSVHSTGQKITIDLKTEKLSVEDANVDLKTEVDVKEQ